MFQNIWIAIKIKLNKFIIFDDFVLKTYYKCWTATPNTEELKIVCINLL